MRCWFGHSFPLVLELVYSFRPWPDLPVVLDEYKGRCQRCDWNIGLGARVRRVPVDQNDNVLIGYGTHVSRDGHRATVIMPPIQERQL